MSEMGNKQADFLDGLFELNRQQLEAITLYCKGGGLERILETSRRWYELTGEQLRLLEWMTRRDNASWQEK